MSSPEVVELVTNPPTEPVRVAERPALPWRPVQPPMPETAQTPDGFEGPGRPDRPDKPDVPKGGPPEDKEHGRPDGTPAAVAISEIVADLFAAFDTSATDGFISVAEIKAVLAPNGHRVGLMGKLADIVADVDTSNDGTLSVEEVTAALGYLDTNDDGIIDRGDFGASADHDTAVALIGILMHLHPEGHHGGG